MKTKQEQIEEIEKVVGHNCNKHGIAKYCPERISNGIYNAGYRKVSDVIDEFVDRIKELLHKHEYRSQTDGIEFYQMNAESFCNEINELADEMRQEVEK